MVVIEVNNHRTGTSILLALIEVISVASSLTFECPNEKHWVRKNMKECWIGIQREREKEKDRQKASEFMKLRALINSAAALDSLDQISTPHCVFPTLCFPFFQMSFKLPR